MKLLVCTTEYFPHGAGIANVVYNVVEQLKGMGVECTVCSPTGPDIRIGNQALIQKTGIGGLINYWHHVSRYFKNNDYDVAWLQNPFILGENPFKRSLVTMHSTYYGSSAGGVGNISFNLYKLIVASIERYCLTRMPPNTRFTGVGEPVCDELKKIGIERERVIYIPNGVNVQLFHPSRDKKLLRTKFGIPRDNIVLLSVGRLTHSKQPHIMMDVFSHIEKNKDNATLCIAGKGELLGEAKSLAGRMGLNNVIFLGHVDYNRDLPDLYTCSDYYIMTSKYEGSPLTLLEAMASGLPCIVSDIPNLKVVKDADCGIIVDFTNTSEASTTILDYLRTDHRVHGLNARDFAVSSLDWKVIAADYLREFRDIDNH